MRYLLGSLLGMVSLGATVNEPFRLEINSGSRLDRIHWHLEQEDPAKILYSEEYRGVLFAENQLKSSWIYRDLSFGVEGNYGVYGKGSLSQSFHNQSFASDQPLFSFQTRGWSAGGLGHFGYAVNLTDGRFYRVILIPSIGYFVDAKKLKRDRPKVRSFQSIHAINGTSYQMHSESLNPFQTMWYGFLFRFAGLIDPGNGGLFRFGYHYQLPCFRLRSETQSRVVVTGGNGLDETTRFFLRPNSVGNLGHTGWLQLEGMLGRWKLGVGVQYTYLSTMVLGVHRKEEVDQRAPLVQTTRSEETQKLKLRSNSLHSWVAVSRSF